MRYDKSAVYLGTPGVNQLCPPHLVGRADTVSIASSPAAAQPAVGPAIEMQSAEVGGGAAATAAPPPRLTVTTTYGADPGAVRQVLSSVRTAGTGSPIVVHQLAPGAGPTTAAPVSTAPDSAAPDSTAPDSTAPGSAAPDSAVPPVAAKSPSAAMLAGRAAKLAARAALLAARSSALTSSPRRAAALAKRAAALARRAALLATQASSLSFVSTPLHRSATSPQSAPVTPSPSASQSLSPASTPAGSPSASPAGSPSPSSSPSSSAPSPSASPPSPSPSASPASTPVRTSYMTTPVPGFDTCTAPSVQAMQAWRHSYSAAAIYIGGAEMACGYGNLSASWVRAVRAMGWSLIPIYVGRQAPCNSFSDEIQPSQAAPEGSWAAGDAVSAAQSLGLGTGSPIYFDMEAYNSGDSTCRDSVLSFLNAWDQELGALHYVSGVYSSAASGVEDLGNSSSIYGRTLIKPESIWFALWDNQANLIGTPYVASSWWTPDRRIKQYEGGHLVTVDGVQLDIDSDEVEGAVYG